METLQIEETRPNVVPPAPPEPQLPTLGNRAGYQAYCHSVVETLKGSIRLRMPLQELPPHIAIIFRCEPNSVEDCHLAAASLDEYLVSLLGEDELPPYHALQLQKFGIESKVEAPEALIHSDGLSSFEFRGRTQVLTQELYRLRRSNWAKSQEVGSLIRRQATAIVLIGLLLILVAVKPDIAKLGSLFGLRVGPAAVPDIPLHVGSMLAGALGGMISSLRQLMDVKMPTGSDLRFNELSIARNSFWTPIAAGLIFGLFIHIFMATGVPGKILGTAIVELLPSIDPNLEGGLFASKMKSGDHAKLLAWCFASGFVPALVPDFIESLVTKAKRSQSGTPSQ